MGRFSADATQAATPHATILTMRHGILGVGGVGGFLGGALARAGCEVVLLMRAETLAAYQVGFE